ncbi:ATP-binding protein [Aneurinibacillus terranovensis]|uniref:ATP-binding protein n=1 Tax=Aneurinibacillus terranovensis TaxID=278991 RepID=UPI0003FD32D8|nr:ATP-binding protein [Aneurinibacillus terranovensis]
MRDYSSFQFRVDREEMEYHLHNAPFAAALLDNEGNVIEANTVLLQATGYTYEQVKTKKFSDFFLTRDPFEAWINQCKKVAYESKKAPRITLKLKTGNTCMCNAIIYNDMGMENYPFHCIVLTNITGKEKPILHYFNQIMDNINLGIVVLNQKALIVEISHTACELLGVKKEFVINRTIKEAFSGMKDEQHFISSSLLDGVTVRNQAYSWRNGDKRFDFIVDSDVLYYPDGEIAGGYYIFKNVTNMLTIEQQIERKDRLAMIGQIAAGTAHEIRNPLTSINGFLQMMSKTLDEAGMVKEKEYTKIMLMEINRINDLVSEFLLLSKQKEVQYQLVDVEQVFTEILPIVKNEALLHGIDVIVELCEEVPLIIGDSELLKQVLLNITKNGIEAMGEKGVLTLRISIVADKVEIAVHDTGPGIPPYLVDKIFDPFFTTKEEGTGLGLPVCQKIVHDMGGSILVSCKGNGTVFRVVLPAR